jgi:hypothetical protein
MPAYARPEDGAVLVTFESDGEDPQQLIVTDGVRAVAAAMRLLAVRERPYPDDKLKVAAAGE